MRKGKYFIQNKVKTTVLFEEIKKSKQEEHVRNKCDCGFYVVQIEKKKILKKEKKKVDVFFPFVIWLGEI